MKIEYLLVFLHLMMIALCRYFIQMTLFLPLVGSVLNSVGCGGKKGGGGLSLINAHNLHTVSSPLLSICDGGSKAPGCTSLFFLNSNTV